MKRYQLKSLGATERKSLINRPRIDHNTLTAQITHIVDAVRDYGDEAVIDFTSRFDKVNLKDVMYTVRPKDEIPLERVVKEAFEMAYNNIYRFHEAQIPRPLTVEPMPGVVCQRVSRPIERVGLYVPGGTAILPSSVLMLAIPAKIAGCKLIILATPPQSNGTIPPEVEFAASLCGVDRVLLAGGAHAIAALAYGTDSVPKVDKILGPGNQYVTAAKMMLQNSDAMISIDMPAGPSEVLVLADSTANHEFVAADLLSQAEHGPDSQVVLLYAKGFEIEKLLKSIDEQLRTLPRAETAKTALKNSYILQVENIDHAVQFINDYAPEHLILAIDDPEAVVSHIHNAGSVFMGHTTPESVGDYASGTNHTLPTYGYARMYSGVSVDSFFKHMTIQKLSMNGLRALGPHVEVMARSEGLEGHARAISVRLKGSFKEIATS